MVKCNRCFFLMIFVALCLFAVGFFSSADAAQGKPISLIWVDNSTNEDGFAIERKDGAGNYALLIRTPVNVRIYDDPNVVEGVTYCYRVNAYNSAGVSAYTNEACKVAEALPPPLVTIPAAPSYLEFR